MQDRNWVSVTTWALDDWRKAQEAFWRAVGDPRVTMEAAERALAFRRAEYRNRVLGWYRKLHLPMRLGDVVPDEVAKLLAEEWNLATRPSKRGDI